MSEVRCNPDYRGGMICRGMYPGASACKRHGGEQLCLMDIPVRVKRDWIFVPSKDVHRMPPK